MHQAISFSGAPARPIRSILDGIKSDRQARGGEIEGVEVMEVLDRHADGWSFEVKEICQIKILVCVTVALGIKCKEGLVVRTGVGSAIMAAGNLRHIADQRTALRRNERQRLAREEATSLAVSLAEEDAFKEAAQKFGIGRRTEESAELEQGMTGQSTVEKKSPVTELFDEEARREAQDVRIRRLCGEVRRTLVELDDWIGRNPRFKGKKSLSALTCDERRSVIDMLERKKAQMGSDQGGYVASGHGGAEKVSDINRPRRRSPADHGAEE